MMCSHKDAKTDDAAAAVVRYVAQGPLGKINSKYCRGHLVVTILGKCNSPSSLVVALAARRRRAAGRKEGGEVVN